MEATASTPNVTPKPPHNGRLLRRAEFLANKAMGKSWNAKSMIVSVSPNNWPDLSPRIGLTVTKAVGNAVVRNRIRRRLRHLAKAECAHLRGVDIVLIGKQPAETLEWEQLQRDLRWCLKRLEF